MKNQALQRALIRSKGFITQNSPTILTCVGAVGVVATSVATAKATTKASKLLEKAKEEEDDLSRLDKIKLVGPAYIPAVLLGAATIASIFGANTINKRRQVALVSAYAALDRSYKEFKEKAGELYGEEAADKIREGIAKDKYKEYETKEEEKEQLFYDEYSNRYFESTLEKVQRAQYRLNRTMVTRDYAYLNEYYEFLGLDTTDPGYSLGWSMGQCMDMYWQSWIDFTNTKIVLDDGRDCYVIRMICEPIPNFADYI